MGGAVARRLAAGGWRVRALHRDPTRAAQAAPGPDAAGAAGGFDWARGDAMAPGDVIAAASGAALIVHAVNPPASRSWDRLGLPMLEAGTAAAKA
ncbi:membrane protein, partial [Methylobacterium indicum]